MRNSDLTHLRKAVRDEIAHAFMEVGFAKPRDIARRVFATQFENINSVCGRLAKDALTNLARRELRSTHHSCKPALQIRMLGVPQYIINQLRSTISIPGCDVDDDEAVIFKPLFFVTIAEFEAHLQLLSDQITADKRRHSALRELRDQQIAAGATGESRVIDILCASASLVAEVA